jgi:predicted Co/Zn/Cd cation transporter (cation efflux family)
MRREPEDLRRTGTVAGVNDAPQVEALHDPGDAARRALRVSVAGGAVVVLLAVSIGLWTGSQVILFDGVQAFIGIGLAWIALRAARIVQAGPTDRFPFGREALSPLVVGVEAIALLATCTYAALEAVNTILDGGGELPAAPQLIYASITSVLALWVWWLLRRVPDAEMVAAEAIAWFAGAVLSVAMLVAFGGALVLDSAGLGHVAAYVDPALLLLACVAFVVPPIGMLRSAFHELLEGVPLGPLHDQVDELVRATTERFGLTEPVVRMSKLGPKLYLEVEFLVDGEWTVDSSDRVRRDLVERLGEVPHHPWVTVGFTADRSLIE